MIAELRRFRDALLKVAELPHIVEPHGTVGLDSNSVEMGRLIGMQDAALIARRALNGFDD